MVRRATAGISIYVHVVISPEITTSPVVTSVSQAPLPLGSFFSTASSTASEIWSASLSGCPSLTDSDVNKNSWSSTATSTYGAEETPHSAPVCAHVIGAVYRPSEYASTQGR